MLNNYIKTLLLSTIVSVVYSGNNYCYSLNNNNNININQDDRIHYSNNTIPSINQMIKCANYEAINTSSNEYKRCFEFFKEKGTEGISILIQNFLGDIYNIANSLIFDISYERSYGRLYKGISNWEFQNQFSKNPYIYNTSGEIYHYMCDHKQLLEMNNILLPGQQDIAILTTHFMNDIHSKLNPNKTQLNNNIDTTNIKNILELCYYIANHLVELSHDIIYAINNKIDEYKTNPNTYSFANFRTYIEDKIIIPSYTAIMKVSKQIYDYFTPITPLILTDHINSNIPYILDKFFKDIRHSINIIKDREYNNYLLCCSTLYHELHVKRNNIIDLFKNSLIELSNINNKLRTKQFNSESKLINAHIYDMQKLEDRNKKKTSLYCVINKGDGILIYLDYNKTYEIDTDEKLTHALISESNDTIMNRANAYLQDVVQTINDITNKKLIDNDFYPNERNILINYFFMKEHIKYYDESQTSKLEKLFDDEQKIFSKQITQFNNELKNINERFVNLQFEPINANYDYIGELINSFNKYQTAINNA